MKRKKKIRTKKCPNCKNNICKLCKGAGVLRAVNGRNKGGNFERAIAREISAWSGIHCSRVPMSGGWNKQSGDITPKDPKDMVDFPYVFELKNQEILELSSVFSFYKNKKLPLTKWWLQASGDAKRASRTPILVFTKSHYPVYCLMRKSTFHKLGFHKITKNVIHLPKHRIILWDDFLKLNYQDAVWVLKNG